MLLEEVRRQYNAVIAIYKSTKKCAKLKSKAIVSYLTTRSGANSNQWLCQECNFSVFPFYTLSNEEFLREQNFSNDPTPTDYVSPNVNANLLNSWFCDLDDSEDENLHVSNQYIETNILKRDEIANATSISFRLLCLNI